MTLTDFLLARYAEEAAAIPAADWDEISRYMARELRPGAPIIFTESHMLAEVEAKRRIVELWMKRDAYIRAANTDVRRPDNYDIGLTDGLDDALCLLALPYADHPDYRAEWMVRD